MLFTTKLYTALKHDRDRMMDQDASTAADNRRNNDRRQAQDPAYTGQERRKGDRRQIKTPSAA
jgi:hypothetical protein